MTVERAVVLGVPRSGTTFPMHFLDALSEADCVTGHLLPIGIAHLAAQELPGDVRNVLERSFRGSLADYLTTGIYLSRSAALRKWWAASRTVGGLRLAAKGTRTETGISTTTRSGYCIRRSSATALTPATASPSDPRIDLVYLQINDAAYTGS